MKIALQIEIDKLIRKINYIQGNFSYKERIRSEEYNNLIIQADNLCWVLNN